MNNRILYGLLTVISFVTLINYVQAAEEYKPFLDALRNGNFQLAQRKAGDLLDRHDVQGIRKIFNESVNFTNKATVAFDEWLTELEKGERSSRPVPAPSTVIPVAPKPPVIPGEPKPAVLPAMPSIPQPPAPPAAPGLPPLPPVPGQVGSTLPKEVSDLIKFLKENYQYGQALDVSTFMKKHPDYDKPENIKLREDFKDQYLTLLNILHTLDQIKDSANKNKLITAFGRFTLDGIRDKGLSLAKTGSEKAAAAAKIRAINTSSHTVGDFVRDIGLRIIALAEFQPARIKDALVRISKGELDGKNLDSVLAYLRQGPAPKPELGTAPEKGTEGELIEEMARRQMQTRSNEIARLVDVAFQALRQASERGFIDRTSNESFTTTITQLYENLEELRNILPKSLADIKKSIEDIKAVGGGILGDLTLARSIGPVLIALRQRDLVGEQAQAALDGWAGLSQQASSQLQTLIQSKQGEYEKFKKELNTLIDACKIPGKLTPDNIGSIETVLTSPEVTAQINSFPNLQWQRELNQRRDLLKNLYGAYKLRNKK